MNKQISGTIKFASLIKYYFSIPKKIRFIQGAAKVTSLVFKKQILTDYIYLLATLVNTIEFCIYLHKINF